MKKIILILFLIPILSYSQVSKTIKKVSLKINFKSTAIDTFYITISPMAPLDQDFIGNPDTLIKQTKKECTFHLSPGMYKIGIFCRKATPLRKNFVIKSTGEIHLEADLEPIGVPENIKSVSLSGEFNNWDNKKEINLIQKGDLWILADTVKLPENSNFAFYLNHNYFGASLSNPSKFISHVGHFDNYYNGEKIIFDTRLYAKGSRQSKLRGIKDDPMLDTLFLTVKKIEKEMMSALMDTKLTDDDKTKLFALQTNKINTLIKNHPTYKQLFISPQLFADMFNPGLLNFSKKIFLEQADSIEILQIVNSESFKNAFIHRYNIIKEADQTSPYLKKDFIFQEYSLIVNVLKYKPNYLKSLSLSQDSFFDYVKKYLSMLTNKNDNIINGYYFLASAYLNIDINKAREAIAILKARFPDDPFVKGGDPDKMLNSVNFKTGSQAPNFKLKSTSGDSINLSDFRGKFVFLDFWGTWCKPCVMEIPNIIKLQNNIREEKLVIIGMASDKEENVKKFTSKNDIKYKNAVISKDILDIYFISAFPTTLLIDPDGKILAKNLRGEKLTEIVKAKMEKYNSKH